MESKESVAVVREQTEQGGGAPKDIPSGDGEAAPGQQDGTPEQMEPTTPQAEQDATSTVEGPSDNTEGDVPGPSSTNGAEGVENISDQRDQDDQVHKPTPQQEPTGVKQDSATVTHAEDQPAPELETGEQPAQAETTSQEPDQEAEGPAMEATVEGDQLKPPFEETQGEEERLPAEGSRPETKGNEHERPQTEDSKQEGSERPVTEQSKAASTQSEDSKERREKDRKEKDKKKRDKDKKEKKRSKQTREEKRSSKSGTRSQLGGSKHLEAILLSMFQPFDPEGTGYVDPVVFWEVLQSAEVNLQLSGEEVAALQEVVQSDQSGQMPFAEFATHAADIIASLYQSQPASEAHWVELRTADGAMVVSYNKQTGDVREAAEVGIDLFAEIIQDMFQLADAQGKGYVSREEFSQMLQSEQMVTYLTEEDILQMQQYFDAIPGGQATYADFYPLAKELILRVYRVKDPSDSEWCQLTSAHAGLFWFNKHTGETRRDVGTAPSNEREQEIAFLNQAYAQVEAVNFELEQYKQQNRDLENQLAQANEEQETLAAQLYETGHALDEATAEIQNKEEELEELRTVIVGKDQEMEDYRTQIAELETLKERLAQTEQELQNARDTIAARDSSITERDASIRDLQRQIDAITERLKTSHGIIDARDSSISSLQHKLQSEQTLVSDFEKQVPSMESRISATEDELKSMRQTLEERTAALAQTRKHLRNARERNLELEKEVEKLAQTQEKLRGAECEIHTLKSFLTSKTAMVERRKKELKEVKVKVAQLEEKDTRRAVILADVLEKTARQYQQQLTAGPHKGIPLTAPQRQQGLIPSDRPLSAPAIPPEDELFPSSPPPPVTDTSPEAPRVMKTFTIGKSTTPTTAPMGFRTTKPAGRKGKMRSRTVPKLPPIRKPPQRRDFHFPTSKELRQRHREQDSTLIDHTTTNQQCTCEMCLMNASFGSPGLQLEAGFSGLTAQTGYRSGMDAREQGLVEQIRVGQRVLVKMKKSEYDLEPQKLTGVVKYVGKIDSEFIDNRLYVGVKLDEAIGDTDGLIKGKRYFTCPPQHGKVVRITNVVAVLPSKSVFYKPLQGISKRSPYTTVQQRKTTLRVT